MSFRLVSKSVTLNVLERCSSPNLCLISPNSVAFGADCVEMVEDTPVLSAAEMYAKESSFSDISHTATIGMDHPYVERNSPLASEKLTITWKRCKGGGKLVSINNRKSYSIGTKIGDLE